MPKNSGEPPNPTHWSKDFAEHLRTVHFALIGVSVGLVLIVFSARPYDPEIAIAEVRQILELKEDWSASWRRRSGSSSIVKSSTREAVTDLDIDNVYESPSCCDISSKGTFEGDIPSDLSTVGEVAKNPDSVLQKDELRVSSDAPLSGTVDIGKGPELSCQFSIGNDWVQNDISPHWSPEAFPKKLWEFRQWWDALQHHPFGVIYPETVSVVGHSLRSDSYTINGVRIASSTVLPQGRKRKKVELSLLFFQDQPVYQGRLVSERVSDLVMLPVHRFEYAEATPQSVADRFGWSLGPFEHSFPDLSSAADHHATSELSDLEMIISSDAAKENEVFEAFGMRVPAAKTAFWGSTILLSVQLYLFVYLKRLSGKLYLNDPAWDVPWIGMDLSRLARILFFTTIVVLPMCAFMSLAWHEVSRLERTVQRAPWTTQKEIGLLVVLPLGLVIGLASWKYRPRLQGYPEQSDESGNSAT